MTDLDQPIGELMAPLTPQMEQLTSIPGVEATAARLASWVGVCPGNDERAGKRRSGRTRKRSRPWSDSATASPENAWPSGEALHLSSSTRHSALPQGATRE